jgi:hypothetical protein
MNLYRFFWSIIMVYYMLPHCHKDSRFNSIKNGLYQDWRHHPLPSGNYNNQLQVSWGAKFKFWLNVNLNNFIIEHTVYHWNQNPLACSSGPQDYFPGSLGRSENTGVAFKHMVGWKTVHVATSVTCRIWNAQPKKAYLLIMFGGAFLFIIFF